MADDSNREPLGDYLDRMIETQYGKTERGRGWVSQSPLHMAIIEYIEDEATGRPHPIEDAADHYLLRMFDQTRRDMGSRMPVKTKFQGTVFTLTADGSRVSIETNECSGTCWSPAKENADGQHEQTDSQPSAPNSGESPSNGQNDSSS